MPNDDCRDHRQQRPVDRIERQHLQELIERLFTVDDILHASLEYDPTGNTDADADSDGTTIQINRHSTAGPTP